MRENKLSEMSTDQRRHEQRELLSELMSQVPGVKHASLTLVDEENSGSTNVSAGCDADYLLANALRQVRQATAKSVQEIRDEGIANNVLSKIVADVLGHFTDGRRVAVFVTSETPSTVSDDCVPVLFSTNIDPRRMADLLQATLDSIRDSETGEEKDVDWMIEKPSDK